MTLLLEEFDPTFQKNENLQFIKCHDYFFHLFKDMDAIVQAAQSIIKSNKLKKLFEVRLSHYPSIK